MPRTASEQVTMAAASDPVDRDIGFVPPATPYDPRHMLAGTTASDGSFETGFFDVGSFTEYVPRRVERAVPLTYSHPDLNPNS